MTGIANGISHTEFVGIGYKEVGDTNMSLCLALIFHDKVYIASDSKSSKAVADTEFGDKIFTTIPISYTYKKIFVVENEESPIVGMSYGYNNFEDKDLTEFIASLPASDNIAETIRNTMNGKVNLLKMNTAFALYQYRNKELYCTLIEKVNGEYQCKETLMQPTRHQKRKCSYGATWAVELSDYAFPKEFATDESNIIFSINELYKKAEAVGPCFDDSVGGPTRICKLTPDGFTWLQNGYEL